jgi:hypothetical protein
MAEDAGHDRWFLTDLLAIDGGHPDLGKLFSKEHAAVRHLSYGLLSEVYRPQADEERLVFLLALESSSHVFFERVVRYFRDSGVRKALKYFGDAHLDAENAHEMFEESLEGRAGRRQAERGAACAVPAAGRPQLRGLPGDLRRDRKYLDGPRRRRCRGTRRGAARCGKTGCDPLSGLPRT